MFDIATLYASTLDGPGLFIVLEGIDGSGKSVQSLRLYKRMLFFGHLGGVDDIHHWRQPTNEQYGRKTKKFSGASVSRMPLVEFTLFLADRIEQAEKVRSAIRRGEVVLMDRCYHSSVAYQSATGHLSPWDIYHSNRIIFPKPDLLITIDVDPSIAIERIGKRTRKKDVFEKEDFLAKAREIYLELTKLENGFLIKGDQPIDKVEEDIWKAFMEFLNNHNQQRKT
jgi:dTMP kinase